MDRLDMDYQKLVRIDILYLLIIWSIHLIFLYTVISFSPSIGYGYIIYIIGMQLYTNPWYIRYW